MVEIPKKIHQTWYTKNVPYLIKRNINYMKNLNPEFEYFFYDDEDILDYIKKNYDDRILRAYKKLKIGASKADYFRYLVLYKEGGIYLDLDALIIKNLNNLIKDKSALISREGKSKVGFLQWLLMFSKGHPLLKKIIDDITENIFEEKHSNILLVTGPAAFTKSINNYFESIEDILHKNDDEINSILEKSDNQYIKNTKFFGVDYNEYAQFKSRSSFTMYMFNSHWKNGNIGIYIIFAFFILLFILYFFKF